MEPALQGNPETRFEHSYALAGRKSGQLLSWFADGLQHTLRSRGHQPVTEAEKAPRVVFHCVDPLRPRPYRRKAQATFVVTVAEGTAPPADVLAATYPLLIRTLANLLIYLSRDGDRVVTHFVTLEQGYYTVPLHPDREAEYFAAVYSRLAPLASSRLVLGNVFVPDLPEALWQGDAASDAIGRAGRKLAALDLLPTAFPIEELLPPRDMQHVRRLFGIGGLSYGNLSARRDSDSFWMSASGVDKANLTTVGREVLLVTGYDPVRDVMLLSVPPGVQPRRVSVDAIEHWLIYREHLGVGAIVHVHAWMDGIPATAVNYPCGTLELATEVSNLVRQAPDPTRAVVGLKNHGLTITGRDMDDIFERIEGRILPRVPMS